jgi:hypothetical protein
MRRSSSLCAYALATQRARLRVQQLRCRSLMTLYTHVGRARLHKAQQRDGGERAAKAALTARPAGAAAVSSVQAPRVAEEHANLPREAQPRLLEEQRLR